MKINFLNKLLILVFLWIPYSSIVAQVVDSSEIVFNSFPEIHSCFLKCNESKPNLFTGLDTTFAYDDDELITIVHLYENGKNVKTIGYYSNNQKYRESNYSNGKLNGKDASWYKDGKKQALVYYNKGKRSSAIITWHDNGKTETIFDLDTEINNGYSISFYKNENVYLETFAIDSTLNGFIEKEYYKDGGIKRIERANLGKQQYLTYYINGQIAWDGMIINAIWNQVGQWQEWYEDGSLKREYYFNDSIPKQKEKIWKWWDEKGNLIKQEHYKDGIMIEEKQTDPLLLNNNN